MPWICGKWSGLGWDPLLKIEVIFLVVTIASWLGGVDSTYTLRGMITYLTYEKKHRLKNAFWDGICVFPGGKLMIGRIYFKAVDHSKKE